MSYEWDAAKGDANARKRDHVAEKKEPLEKTIRRVIREELKRQGAA